MTGCVPASVPTGADSLWQVNVSCDVVVSDSGFEIVEPQTFSLSRKREASVAVECETKMHAEGPPVKTVPETVRRRPRRKIPPQEGFGPHRCRCVIVASESFE